MTDVGGVGVAEDVGRPFILGGIGVSGADVTGLESLEILDGAELVSHGG